MPINQEKYPILEYDFEKKSIIQPKHDLGENSSEFGILCFSHLIFEKYVQNNLLSKIYEFESAVQGKIPVYSYRLNKKEIIVMNPGFGAPFAAASLECMISMGCNKIIACGMAGVLDSNYKVGFVILPKSAIRDEGVSYHYIQPSREISMNPDVLDIIKQVLATNNISFQIGKVWTTDGLYRETKDKIEMRAQEGCIAVDMETSALLAVAKFHNIKFGHMLGCGDDVSGDKWDKRSSIHPIQIHEQLFHLALESVLKL